eukprot:362275-Chlamydomonas_euryale.AAC.2
MPRSGCAKQHNNNTMASGAQQGRKVHAVHGRAERTSMRALDEQVGLACSFGSHAPHHIPRVAPHHTHSAQSH